MIRKAIFEHRNTTLIGLSMILLAVGTASMAIFDGDANTTPNWDLIIPELLAAIGLIVAGDGGKS